MNLTEDHNSDDKKPAALPVEGNPVRDVSPGGNDRPVTESTASAAENVEDAPPLTSSQSESSDLNELLRRLEESEKKATSYQEHYLRAAADLDNFRRRMSREREDMRLYAVSSLAENLLPVLDNLQLGLHSSRQSGDLSTLQEGLEMVVTQFRSVLEQVGLVEVCPGPGDAFDPHKHEAVSQQISADIPEGAVLHLIRSGYTLNNRLLRAATVVVSAGAGQPDGSSQPEQ